MNITLQTNKSGNLQSFGNCGKMYKSAETVYNGILSKDQVYTTTSLFRPHLDWNKFINYVIENFKNKEKVNIYSLGCSDGSEAYSYAIALTEKLPKSQHQKYLPIMAFDIDSEVIQAAQSGKINLTNDDFNAITKNINIDKYGIGDNWHKKFFQKAGSALKIGNDISREDFQSIYNPRYSYTPAGNIKDSVKFYESDVLSAINRINDDGNSIVNTCHVLSYCEDFYVEKVLNALGEKLKPGSIYVFDKFYLEPSFIEKIQNRGFILPDKNMCFAKKLS